MAENDVLKMKVADLKKELKIRGLLTTGNKIELVERLQSALIEGDVFDDTAISEELLDEGDDVLNDDELDEETKSYLNSTQDEDAILKSPQGSITSQSPGEPVKPTPEPQPQKKVVLKRKLTSSISLNEAENNTNSNETPDAKISKSTIINNNQAESIDSNNGTAEDKNVVKLSQLTMKERLELRAKKFGAPASADALKLARAERFGISSDGKSNPENSSIKATAPVSVDVLKKRAERFGGSVSKVMTKIENKEKLQKRQERFGSLLTNKPTTDATPATNNGKNEYAEKAKLRLERFKTAVK